MSPCVRLPLCCFFTGWSCTCVVVWVRLGWLCLCCAVGVHLRGVGGLNHVRDGSMLVRCWVSGAALVCPWALLFAGVHCCVFRWWGGVVLCENCIVDASIFLFLCFGVCTLIVCVSVCFVTGVWWMPWHAEPMKDV